MVIVLPSIEYVSLMTWSTASEQIVYVRSLDSRKCKRKKSLTQVSTKLPLHEGSLLPPRPQCVTQQRAELAPLVRPEHT